jgi:hypothetical protein
MGLAVPKALWLFVAAPRWILVLMLRFAKRWSDLDEGSVDATVDDSALVFGH